MGRENITIVRRAYAAFNSGDLARITAVMHPEFETTVGPELSAEPDTYRGHDGIRRYFESFREAMDEIRFDQEAIRQAGASVVVAVRLSARGRSTRIHVEQRLGQVWTFRQGRALRVRTFSSFPEAMRAAGLSDQDVPRAGRDRSVMRLTDSTGRSL